MRWIALFIVLPALELALLIEIGSRIGTAATLGLIVLTGLIGGSLARYQGLRVIADVQREMAQGGLPAGPLLDGLLILLAAATLVTPGIVTDVFGFLCLTPGFRDLVKREILRRIERAVREERLHVTFVGTSGPAAPGAPDRPREVDVTARGEHQRHPPGAD